MANDPKFTEAMQSFSKSIEIFAQAILNQVNKKEKKDDEKISASDSKGQTQAIYDIAKNIDVISKRVENADNNSKEILKSIQKLKEDKQDKGLLGRLSKSKDKNKSMAEGIQNIGLMAGAILAIGTAFKIVGDVDFESVLALSIALPLMALAFDKVGETARSPKESMNVAIGMVFMSAGIAASGLLLSYMPSLSLGQMFSAVVVAAAIGVAIYGLAVSADEIGANKIKALYSIIPAMPFVAGGILASGMILQSMPTLGMTQFLSAVGVGVAMGASMVPLAIASKIIGKDATSLFTVALAMPVIAGGILASAYILQDIPDVDTMGMLETTTSITASLLIMGAGIFLLNKMGVDPGMAVKGALVMPIVSAALMASSWILSVGNYKDGPSVEWASGFGLSMLASIPAVIGFGALAATGFGAIVIAAGILSMLAVAGGIAAASEILAGGTYTGGPSVEWAGGVGMALMSFTNAIDTLKPNIFDMLFSSDTMDSKIESIVKIGGALKEVASVIKGGSYTGGPSKEWSEGVGIALMTFANALNAIKPNVFERLLGDSMDQNIASIIKLGYALPEIGKAVGKDVSMYTGGPKKEWAEGVGGALSAFAGALEKVKPGFFDRLFGDTLQGQINGMIEIARALPKIGNAIGKDVSMYQGGPDKDWAQGTGDSVIAFATAIATMADEIDADEINDWIYPMKQIAGVMAHFAQKLNGQKFDNYPSKDWSKGILGFMEGVAEWDAGSDVKGSIKNINAMSNANFKLARSISTIAYSLKKIKKIPDLTNLYSGLITLSVIDSENLNGVLDKVSEKKQKFSDLLKIVSDSTNVTQSGSKYNAPDKKPVGSGGSGGSGGSSGSGGSGGSVTPKNNTPSKPQEVIIKDDKTAMLMEKLIGIQSQMNTVLNEIADNTSNKNNTPSNISH
jgi:uncharacterized membrane protein YgcG